MMEMCTAKWLDGPSKGQFHTRHRWVHGRCKWCGLTKADVTIKPQGSK